MKKLLFALLALVALAGTASAQITIPYANFVAGADILSAEVDANNAALADESLNRTGGIVTGAIASSGGSLTGSWAGSPSWTANPAFTGTGLFDADALRVADTNASHFLIFTPGSDLTANRVLTLTTGDAARTITLSGDPTLADWFDQSVKAAASPTFVNITSTSISGSGTALTALNGSNIASGTVADARLPVTMDDKVMTDVELTNYRETKTTASISAGALALNLATANHFAVALNANITSFTVTNVPTSGKAAAVTIAFTADGTIRTITWPVTTKWANATTPTMTGTNNKIDIITLYTTDGGTTWYGFVAGQNF